MYNEDNFFWGGTKKLISLYKLLTYLPTLKDCEKTNEDRNVIPKAAKSWVKNPESAWVRLPLALKLLLKKPTRTFERSEIVKFGAPPKIFFQNFRKIFPKFLVLLELRFYLCSFSRNLSEYGGIVLNFQKFHESISWLYRAETAVVRPLSKEEDHQTRSGQGYPWWGGTLWIQRHRQKIPPQMSLVPPHQSPPSQILSRG